MQASLARIAPAIDPAATAIRDLERLSGGATQEIWRFALVGPAAPTIKILRRAPHGATGEGTRDLLFVFGVSSMYDGPGANYTGTLTAYDAMTGAVVWSKTTSGSGGHASASPAIDPSRQYVYCAGQDGKVHKYHVGNGQEVTSGGWPVTVTLKPDAEKIASALAIADTPSGTFLYAVTNGYNGDGGDYQGHLVAIDLADASTTVFNAMCSDQTALIDEGGCQGISEGGILHHRKGGDPGLHVSRPAPAWRSPSRSNCC